MLNLGLVGKNISHSKSQQMYEELLGRKINYSLLDFENPSLIEPIEVLFEKYEGISITAPYKGHFISQVEIENPLFKEINAINCIKKENEKYYGTNTDYSAVSEILTNFLVEEPELSICLLGSGAMAKMTISLLEEKGVAYLHFSRKTHADMAHLDFTKVNTQKKLVINACSREFIFEGELDKNDKFWDYNYNYKPHMSRWGGRVSYLDGLTLLKLQAKHALDYWKIPTN